jgi:hypothetical protein
MTGLHRNPPAKLLAAFGCSKEFWIELRDIGNAMMKAGGRKDATPLRAYSHQRTAAMGARGIEWKLTLPEWWTIWTLSGHWHERGVGRGYHMCRRGDVGPYVVGNVFIAPGVENLSAATKKSGLPIGVARVHKSTRKPYRAICTIGGKQRHLGVFATVSEARSAYLAAIERDIAPAKAA